jgi:chromosome segregation ATPase
MSENDRLHDALERQSELIKALRLEIATKDKRIADLEQTILYLTAQCQECVEQLTEGKDYSEGCKP